MGIAHDSTNSTVDLEIRNSSAMTVNAPRTVEISVRDRASGQLIVAVPLTADQLLAALAGTHHGRLPAWVCPPELRDRIGLKSVHASHRLDDVLPKEAMRRFETRASELRKNTYETPTFSRVEDVAEAAVVAWLTAFMAEGGWTEFRISNHNYGWGVHFTKYVDPATVTPAPWEEV